MRALFLVPSSPRGFTRLTALHPGIESSIGESAVRARERVMHDNVQPIFECRYHLIINFEWHPIWQRLGQAKTWGKSSPIILVISSRVREGEVDAARDRDQCGCEQ